MTGSSPSWEAITVGIGLFATMSAYALFAGADFGGGIWDLLAGGTARGARPRATIDASVTPVWEGNQVWIVLGLVLLWTAFPPAFAAVMTSLFVPLSLSLLGIVLRGIGFAFRHEAQRVHLQQLAGALFAVSSLIAPFFLGTVVGAVATGRITPGIHRNNLGAWTSPTAIVTGLLFVAACAYVAAVYLVGDATRRGEPEMARYFSRRALAAGVVTGLLAAGNMALLRHSGPYIYHRLLGPALPLVAVSVVAGLAALVVILLRRIWVLRLAAAVAVGGVIAAWGYAQYPYLLPTTLDLQHGSAPNTALLSELVVMGLAAVFVVPSFVYLYVLQQQNRLQVSEDWPELRAAVAAQDKTTAPPPAPPQRNHPIAVAALLGAAALELLRETLRRRRSSNTPP